MRAELWSFWRDFKPLKLLRVGRLPNATVCYISTKHAFWSLPKVVVSEVWSLSRQILKIMNILKHRCYVGPDQYPCDLVSRLDFHQPSSLLGARRGAVPLRPSLLSAFLTTQHRAQQDDGRDGRLERKDVESGIGLLLWICRGPTFLSSLWLKMSGPSGPIFNGLLMYGYYEHYESYEHYGYTTSTTGTEGPYPEAQKPEKCTSLLKSLYFWSVI